MRLDPDSSLCSFALTAAWAETDSDWLTAKVKISRDRLVVVGLLWYSPSIFSPFSIPFMSVYSEIV